MACLMPLYFVSCSSDDENELDELGSSQKTCTITIDDVKYHPIPGSFIYETDNYDCYGYDDRPLYSQYSFFAEPEDMDNYYTDAMYIDVHVPDFAKGFKFTSENTSMHYAYNRYAYVMTSGSATVTSFDNKNCVTEFKNCVFTNVKDETTIKIDGKLKLEVD